MSMQMEKRVTAEFEKVCNMLMSGQCVNIDNNVNIDNEFYAHFGMSVDEILSQLIDNLT